MKIVHFSDIHVESGGLFRPDLMERIVEETNQYGPDLVAMAGDLTGEGYKAQFEEAKGYLDRLECPNVVAVMGNHDARNIGYRYFQELFGLRNEARVLSVSEGEAKVVALDTTKPDLDDGEVGREYYGWLDSELRGWDRGPRIVVLHHHILAVPGTGRDANILRDAGDVTAVLRDVGVDLVLAGHRHVPYFWNLSGVRVVHSGTAATEREDKGDRGALLQHDRARRRGDRGDPEGLHGRRPQDDGEVPARSGPGRRVPPRSRAVRHVRRVAVLAPAAQGPGRTTPRITHVGAAPYDHGRVSPASPPTSGRAALGPGGSRILVRRREPSHPVSYYVTRRVSRRWTPSSSSVT